MLGVKGRVAALAALAVILVALAVTQLAAAAPTNDAFAAAASLSGATATATGTNVAATRETGEPMHGGVTIETGSVWWKWTAPQSGTIRVDTLGSDFDTVLGVYTGGSVSALTTVASNDNAIGTYASEVSFAATAGTTYAIAVAGFNYWTGNIRLSINAPHPANDSFASAQALTGATGSLSASNARATAEPGEPAHWGGGPYHSLWYSWTGDVASRVTFGTSAPTGGSPAVVVYTGDSLATLTRVAAGGAGATFLPTPGTRYWIALDDWYVDDPFILTWSRPGPTNDNFDTSTFELLRGASGSVDSNTYFATKQPGEPAHGGNAGGASVWYLWAPGANGRVRISTAASGFDTLLAVYSGSSLTALTPLASNDDAGSGGTTSALSVDLNGGTNASYWIAVDGKNGATGPLKLTWSAVPPPNDDLANAAPITGTSGSASANLLGATVEPDEPTGMYDGPSVWWSWTPSTSGVAVFDTIGSPGDSTIRIFRGSSIASLVGVAQDHDSGDINTRAAKASFVFRAGVRYLIQASTWDGGSVTVNWRVDAPIAPATPANDAFAAATPIAGEIGHAAGTVFGATNEAGEPRQREGGASVWYRWTAPADGAVYFSLPTIDGTWPAIVDVYRGSVLGGLTLEDAGDVYGPAGIAAVAGRTYSIRVWSYNGFGSSFVLDWNRDQPAPPNDYFSAAQALAGASGAVPATTYNATIEADEPQHGVDGGSVWYRWRAPATGTYRFDIGSPNGAIDIFTGESIRTLARKTVAYGGTASLAADAGVTYAIALAGGPYHATLTWADGAPAGGVANDAFAAAAVLSGDHGTVSGTNLGATSEGGEPAVTAWGSVWFRFQAPVTGTYAFDTFGSGFDTVLGAYAGSSVDALTTLALSDDVGGATTSLVSVGAQAGTTLWIAVASNGQYGPRGGWTLNWKRSFTTPPNDAFASPTVVTGASGSATASNVGASKEPGEPNHGGQPGGASVWFSWTAPQNGPFTFRAENPALAARLGVYTGTAVGALTPVASTGGAGSIRFTVVAGTTYRIAVDGWYDDGTTQRVDTGSFDLTWAPRPDNDDLAAARVLDPAGGATGSTLVGASVEPGEPPTYWYGGSVWFKLTAPSSGVYAVSVEGGGDTALDAWTGSSVSTLTRVAVAGEYGPPALSLPANAGTTYYVRVALDYGAPQAFTLRWSRGGPDNDAFAAAQPLSALLESGAWTRAVTASGTNAGASAQTGEPLHAGQPGGASVWWTFVAPVAGYVSVDTAGSTFDTLLGVYTGETVSALTRVASDDDAAGAGASRAVFWSPANALYRIAVDGKGGATGVIRIRVQPANPANDSFAAAQTLSGASGALTANNNGATKEAGEPDHAGDPGGHSLWYRWTAPATGAYDFDVAADYFGALVGIYTGSAVGVLTPVASAAGDEFGGATASLGATAGTTYMIAIDGSVYGLQTGQIRLSWRPDAAATSNDMFGGAQSLTGWSGSLSGTTSAATSEAGEPAIGIGHTLWYRWTAPADGAVAFDLEHPFDGAAIDPVGALYAGPSVGALVRVSDISPAVHQRVTAGTTYWLQVDDSEEAGTFVLDWRQLAPPANDDYANAAAITADHASLHGTLADATRERGEPAHGTSPTATVSAWYRWTAPRSGRATIDLRPGTIDEPDANALVNVYTGDALTSLARVTGSAEWWGREVAARAHFDAVAGTTYSIAVTRWPGLSLPLAGDFRLNLALPPANDAFGAAQPLAGTSGTVIGRNSGATKEPGEPDHAGNRGGASVWYRWTAPASGTVVFDTVGSTPDTLLAAYTGTTVSTLSELARDDQAGGANDARLVFDATAGTTYSIALDGFYGPYLLEAYGDTDTGDTVVNWRMTPANDAFAAAERLLDRSGRIAGTTVGATKEAGEPAHAGDAGGRSVWYVWTAGADGDVTVDTSGSSFDTLLGVYTGSTPAALTRVAASDDADGLQTSHVRFHATGGTTYELAVDGKAGAAGRLFLQWRLEGAPSNDDLGDALPLPSAKGHVLVDNTWATKEPGEPAHAGVAGGASVWYSWTSPVNARVTFETERDYSPDTALGVYTGGGYGSLTQVAASDDRSVTDPSSSASFVAVAGTTYLIAVDTRNGVYGTFSLWWNRPPDNDDRLTTHTLTGAGGSYTQTNSWASTQVSERPIAGQTGGASVWFAWTAPASGTVTFDTVGSDFDTLLALYPDYYYDWTQLAADDDSGGAGTSRLSFAVTAGQSYEIVVDGKGGAMGTVQLHWSLPVPAPANDALASAYTLSGPAASSSTSCNPCTTVGATTEPGEPPHAGAGHSVWFRWTAPATGPVLLTATTGDWALWSTADVYTGGTLGALTQVARSPAAGYESETIWNAVAGTTYAIAVDTRTDGTGNGDTGNVALGLAQTGPVPANNDFASAQAISGDSGSVSGTSANAGLEPGEPQNGGGRTVWYRWTPAAGGRVTLTPSASGSFYYDFPRVAVYVGAGLATLSRVPIDLAPNPNWPQPAPFRFRADPGTTYYLQVDGSNPTPGAPESGPFTLQWSTLAGDYFSGPVRLAGASGTVRTNNALATKEPAEPPHARNVGGHSLWFSWTPSVSGDVTVDTAGSTFDSVLAVYSGSSLGGLTEIAANDDAPSRATSALTFTAVAGTTYRIAVDGYSGAAGDVVLAWSTAGVATDVTPPTAALTTPASSAFVGRQVTVSADAGDDVAVAQVEFFADGVSLGVDTTAPYSVLWQTATHADGATSLTARATDTAGNATTTPVRSVTVDNTAPTATITQRPTSPNASATSTFAFTSNETGATFQCRLDTAAWGACTPPVSYTLAAGDHWFYVQAVDRAGNVGNYDYANWTQVGPAANDAFANAQLLTAASGTVTGTTQNATKETGEPNHAGNAGGHSVWYRWTAQAGGTVTVWTAGSSFDTLLAVYTGTAVGALTRLASNDDVSNRDTTSRLTFTATSGTTYRIAVDGYGGAYGSVALNWSGPAPAVDTTPPDTTITSGPVATTNLTTASFAFTSTESGSTFQCRLDGAAWAACTSPSAVSVAAGTHTFDARATDAAGNVDASPASRSWAVDTTAPETTITGGPSGTVTATTASFTFGASEAATFECRLDGGVWGACTSPRDFGGLAVGAHTFEVRATDAAGNVDASPASRTWTVQAPPPASNDNFANAAALAGASGSTTGTTVGMTKETGEPNHGGNAGGHSIWFAWTAPAAGSVKIDTAGSTFDTLLGVYTGTTVGSLTTIASNDDANGTTQSSVTITAIAGTIYRIAVDGYAGATGSVTVHWAQGSSPSGPANDNFGAATGLAGSATGSTVGATKEAGEPSHAGNAGGHSIWWTWTAPSAGSATLTTAGSNFDTLLAVYTGSTVGALTAVASNDDANGTTQSQLSFTAVAGTTYRVVVDGYGGTTGNVSIRVTQP